MKVLRSTLLAAAALVAAACGDKVNVVQQTPPHNVLSVVVSPATLTLVKSQTAQLTAAVSADSGAVTTPLVWTSSDATKVSVDNTGKVTAVAATPGVAICAAVGGKQGCASIIVTELGTTPATVTILSITKGGLGAPVPLPPTAIAGQIDVTLNISANSAVLDSAIVTVDCPGPNCKTAAKEVFSAAQAAALISLSEMTADQTQPPSAITLSFNTALFNPTTGAVSYLNGLHTIGARVFGSFVGLGGAKTATASTATQVIQLLFGNASGFVGGLTFTPSATQLASAVDAMGFNWKAGGIKVTALPVIFAPGVTVLNATVFFNTIGCSAATVAGIPGPKFITLTNTPPATSWTATFTSSLPGTALFGTATDVGDYEFTPSLVGLGTGCTAALAAGGEAPVVTAVGSDNNNIILAAGGFLNAATAGGNPDPNFIVRLDNVAPTAPTLTMIPNFRTNNWFNDVVVLNGKNAPATPNGTVCTLTSPLLDCPTGPVAAPFDLGSGRLGQVILTARTGLTTDANATVDAAAPVTSTAALAESAPPSAYRLRVRAADLLGNFVNRGTAAANSFGVDRTPPTLALAGPAPLIAPPNVRMKTFNNGPYLFAATDPATPPAAPSGFFNLALTPLTVNQLQRTATTSLWWCPTVAPAGAYQLASTACPPTVLVPNGWNPSGTQNFKANLNVPDENGSTLAAYYTINATVADQAGNVSNVATAVELSDATPPSIGGLSYPAFLTAGGSTTFSSSDLDNLDIQLERMNLIYGAVQPGASGGFALTVTGFAPISQPGGSTFWYPDQQVNGYNQPVLVTTHAFAFNVANLLTNIQTTGAAGANGGAVNAAGVLNTANGIVLDQANNQALTGTPIIPGALPAAGAGVAITNGGGLNQGPVNFVICTGASGVPCVAGAPVNLSVSGAGGLATSTTYTAVAQGTTGVFNNPFSAVQFWAYDPATPATEGWRLFATVGASTTTDGGAPVPAGRNWGYTATFTPTLATAPDQAACPAGTVYQIMAIGISSVPVNGVVPSSVGMALATNVSAKTASVCP
ncbi:MAG TPA: Ig-like domain-containing protein [Gemmatimonadaceae bacterium]|nr:Ig-like domain-containing protein [Gemmatimonadaceae bacterium]